MYIKKRIGIVISDILHLPQNADYKNVNLMIISSFHKKKGKAQKTDLKNLLGSCMKILKL